MSWFASPAEVTESLAATGYLADPATATTAYLAGVLEKPLLVEGPAGVGKTELAKAVSRATGAELVRLQCYEGLDEARALYEWNYKKQLLRIQASPAASEGRSPPWPEPRDAIRPAVVLLRRPVRTAARGAGPTGVRSDGGDKTEVAGGGLRCEVLAHSQLTIPEISGSQRV